MTIALECGCGKSVRVSDTLAGKRMKCPACGATLTVPAALPPPPAEQGEDFEVLDDDTPLPEKPARSRIKAAVAEEEPAGEDAPEPAKKPKKKKKKRPAKEEESDEELYERLRANEARMKRIFRGTAFIVLGAAIIIGVVVVFTVFREDIKWVGEDDPRSIIGMIVFGLMGVAAVIKGVIGLFFGQFFGEDE